jgi:CheY-like chemotaxis protein
MPILDGFQCTEKIRELENLQPQELTRPSQQNNGRIPIFAVSASLLEARRADLAGKGFDGWILKPIDFKRLDVILKGVLDDHQRQLDLYRPGCDWELGGWFGNPGSLEAPVSSV